MVEKSKQYTHAIAIPTREALDKWVLFLAFAVGSAGIIVLKLQDFEPLLAALWPIAVIIFYCIATYFLGRIRIEAEAVGDNCYYLGFIFTLVSLAVTLYLILPQAGESDTYQVSAIREVISGFGIALSSTIAGIFLRVMLSRLRPDITVRDKEARNEINAAMREFRIQLQNSIHGQRHFAIETTQLLAEQRRDMQKISAETMNAHKEALETNMTDLRRFSTQAMEILFKRQDEFHKVAKVNEEANKQALETANLMRQELKIMGKSAESLAHIANESTKVSIAISSLADRLDSVVESISKRFEPTVIEATKTLTNSIQKLKESTSQLENMEGLATKELGSATDALQSGAEKAAEALTQSNDALIETTDKLHKIARKVRPIRFNFWSRFKKLAIK